MSSNNQKIYTSLIGFLVLLAVQGCIKSSTVTNTDSVNSTLSIEEQNKKMTEAISKWEVSSVYMSGLSDNSAVIVNTPMSYLGYNLPAKFKDDFRQAVKGVKNIDYNWTDYPIKSICLTNQGKYAILYYDYSKPHLIGDFTMNVMNAFREATDNLNHDDSIISVKFDDNDNYIIIVHKNNNKNENSFDNLNKLYTNIPGLEQYARRMIGYRRLWDSAIFENGVLLVPNPLGYSTYIGEIPKNFHQSIINGFSVSWPFISINNFGQFITGCHFLHDESELVLRLKKTTKLKAANNRWRENIQ